LASQKKKDGKAKSNKKNEQVIFIVSLETKTQKGNML